MIHRARRPKYGSARGIQSESRTVIGLDRAKRNDPGEINLPGSLYRGVQSAGNPWG
jgi:hypothetical protein